MANKKGLMRFFFMMRYELLYHDGDWKSPAYGQRAFCVGSMGPVGSVRLVCYLHVYHFLIVFQFISPRFEYLHKYIFSKFDEL
jgi:hypothetical protein